MATEAQINANRLNSQKSTGPRTDEGKRSVSQNAIKHGLFAHESVIKCENVADFELHRDAMLGELCPVGVMESMLAERMVSLFWRMLRAERMQNQATDCMIEEEVLPLGRLATKLWSSNVKTLEKLLMHERRLESSFYRTMFKLKKLQIMRRIEREDADERRVAKATAAQNHNSDFVKQSQSAPDLMGATSFAGKDYDDIARPEAARNRANQSQFQEPASTRRVADAARSSKIQGRLTPG